MSTFTKYKKMEKPIAIERYSIDIVNKNSDIIDSELHKLELKNESQDTLLATKEALNAEISRAVAKENNIESSLSNIDNTSDMDKPVSTAQQNALNSALSTHNTSDLSHNDLRLLISNLTTRLNALADSDDTTLDQLSEIVAYIKNNKDLIDGVTTSKVNVSDIIDDLTSNSGDKVLSAKQGTVLNGLITDLTEIVGNKVDKVPGKVLSTNDFTNEDKNKLNGIASDAEVNVQADWNETNTESDAYIKNKPELLGFDILNTSEEVQSNTTAGRLVDALVFKEVFQEVFQSVSEGKRAIASAITDKGIETDARDTFGQMAGNISLIQGGKGDGKIQFKQLIDFSMPMAEGIPQINVYGKLDALISPTVKTCIKADITVLEG